MTDFQQNWSDFDSSSSSRLGSAASFSFDSVSHSSGFLTENSSLFSMSEDDFDQLATMKAKEKFDEVDRVLYEDSVDSSVEVIKECQEWKAKFPHLRIIGNKIFDSDEQGFKRYSPADLISSISKLNFNNSKENKRHTDKRKLSNGLSLRGEKVESNRLDFENKLFDQEEMIEHDGSYEEVFAIDYHTEEKKSLHGTGRGYPPITPINSMRDFVVSSLVGDILQSISTTVAGLILECKTKQKSLDKNDTDKDDKETRLVPPLVTTTSSRTETYSVRNKNPEDVPISFHPLGTHFSRSPSFKPSDLQAVPENSGLDGILTVRQFRHNTEHSHRAIDQLSNDINHKLSFLTDNLRPKSFLIPLSSVFEDLETSHNVSKTADGGRKSSASSFHGGPSRQKQPLPRIQHKPHTASNNNTNRIPQSETSMIRTLNSKLRPNNRINSLPSINNNSAMTRVVQSRRNQIIKWDSTRTLPSSFTSYFNEDKCKERTETSLLKKTDPVCYVKKNFKSQIYTLSCPDISKKMHVGREQVRPPPPRCLPTKNQSCFGGNVARGLTPLKVIKHVSFDSKPRFLGEVDKQSDDEDGDNLVVSSKMKTINKSERNLLEARSPQKTVNNSFDASLNFKRSFVSSREKLINFDLDKFNSPEKKMKRTKTESELHRMRNDVLKNVLGLKFVNEEALKICADLKSSCSCIKQICSAMKESCYLLNRSQEIK